MTNPTPTGPAYCVGVFILEELSERGWDCDRLADEAGVDVSAIERLILGRDAMRQELSEGLATAFGTSAVMWVRLGDHPALAQSGGEDSS